MTVEEKMKNGSIYFCYDADGTQLLQKQLRINELTYDYNQTRPLEQEKRKELLKKIFAEMGEDCYIEPPLRANWGCNTHLGYRVYANFNLTLVDDGDIYIGDNVLIGPNVTLTAGTHPVLPSLRREGGQFNVSIRIGNDVWIGANSVVLPGVTIGDGSVIGAGSVVTRDIPANVVAVGNPCRVMREIGKRDREVYFRDWKIDPALLKDEDK